MQAPGSIPACAGEPSSRMVTNSASKVYPRVCGGTFIAGDDASPTVRSIPACAGEPRSTTTRTAPLHNQGLSPRVRGNPVLASAPTMYEAYGSIPACAGEPAEAYPPLQRAGRWSIPACAGEPHRRSDLRLVSNRTGSIPACAGEPSMIARCGACSPVYPRVCGGTSYED